MLVSQAQVLLHLALPYALHHYVIRGLERRNNEKVQQLLFTLYHINQTKIYTLTPESVTKPQ